MSLEEGFQEGQVVERWSRPKVLIACIVLIGLLGLGVFAFSQAKQKATSVLSAQTKSAGEVRLPTREDADRLLETAKKELNNLSSDNLTSSQAALQKIIQDLQSIQGGKESPGSAFCSLVCKK